MESAGQPPSKRERFRQSRVGRWLDRHEFVKHVLTLMTGTAFAQAVGLLIYPIVTRLFTSHDMGVFGMFSAIVGFLVTVAALRYEFAIVPAKSDDEARALLTLATRINLGVSLGSSVLLGVFGGWLAGLLNTPGLGPWLWLVGPLVFVTAQVIIYTQWLNRKKYYSFVSSNHMTQSLVMSTTRVASGIPGSSVLGLIGSQFLGQAVALLRVFRRTRDEVRAPRAATLKHVARKFRRMPLVNGPNAVVDAIRLNGITVLIGVFFSTKVVGNFNVAWLLIQAPLSLINGALSQVFFQKLAVTPRGEMFSLVAKSLLRSVLLGIVPFALIYFLAPPILPWVLGPEFPLVGDLAAVLVPWLFFNLATSPVSMLFIVVQKQGVMLAFSVVYMVTPLSILWLHHPGILETMTVVSWAMAGLLAIFCLLALWAAREYDRGRTVSIEEGLAAKDRVAEDAE